MHDPNSRYQPNHEEVAAKVIAGEAIIMNFVNGLYYSMNKVGGVVWDCLESGCQVRDIAASVVVRYDVAEDQVMRDLDELLESMLAARIIVTTDCSTNHTSQLPSTVDLQPYAKPELVQHDDMAELLALDPPMPGLGGTGWKNPEDAD